MAPVHLKIAYIGGGSRGWAPKLMYDLALCPDLSGVVALYDIDEAAARLNETFGNWLQRQPGVLSHWRYTTVSQLNDALRGADFVVISIQPGPLELMAEELDIAARYGLFFPVGDSTGAPGLVRGLRSAIAYAGFGRAIAEICPHAWIINYTNPMSICTRTLTRVAPELKVFGCCHEVYAVQELLARLAGQYLQPAQVPARTDIQINVLGINHFTWIDRAYYREHDLLALLSEHIARPGVLHSCTPQEVRGWGDWFRSAEQVKFTLFQRFGLLAAAGDRHLVEFLPGFISSEETLYRWGVIRTPVSWRIERWHSAPQILRQRMSGRQPLELKASGEEGVGQIKALVGLGDVVTNVNLENCGQVNNLPVGAVVETNAHFSRDQIRPLSAGALPLGLASLLARHCANQEMILSAALSGNRDLAFQAVYNDPTTCLPIDAAWEMFTRLLQAGRAYLPGWDL